MLTSRSRYAGVVIAAGGTLFALIMLFSCAWALSQTRSDALELSLVAQEDIALVVQRDIQRNFELYRLSLESVIDGLRKPEVFSATPEIRQAILFERAGTVQYLGSVLVLDKFGNIVIDSENLIPRPGNFSDRQYFLVHQNDPHVGLYISSPFDSRLRNGSPSIALTRRLTSADGSFTGVALLSVQLSYFSQLFDGINLGKHAAIALLQSNGVLTMRQPPIKGSIGKSFIHSKIFSHFTADSGTFIETSSLDGIRRVYAYRKVPKFGLIIVVAASQRDIYAGWIRRSAPIGGLILLTTISFVIVSIMLGAQFRRRLEAEVELANLVRRDSLTGLLNRRALSEVLDGEWQRGLRTGSEFSMLFIDIDYFKAYNDRYGHPAGDQVLTRIAAIITNCTRTNTDYVARYGGEEFVVVLPDSGVRAARIVADKLLRAVHDAAIEHNGSRFERVSISLGLAKWDAKRHLGTEALIKEADAALYRAKASGRNQVGGV